MRRPELTPVWYLRRNGLEEEEEYFPVFFWERQVRWTGVLSWLLAPVQLMAVFELVAGHSLVDLFMLSYFFVVPFVVWSALVLFLTSARRATILSRIGLMLLVAIWLCPIVSSFVYNAIKSPRP